MENQLDAEKMIQALKEMNLTEEERAILQTKRDAEELGKKIGKVIASVLILAIAPTIIWAVLVFIFELQITWLKVFGAYFLFNFIKNILIHSVKKNNGI
jgi:cytoskeletal protein RodZ